MRGVIWGTSRSKQFLGETEECQVECEQVTEVARRVAGKDVAATLALARKRRPSWDTGL